MQDEFDRHYPSLDVSIIGINEVGYSPTGFITDGRDLPWLVDVDADQNGQSDVWYDSWEINYRDVVVVDRANDAVGVLNVTTQSLSDPENYDALKSMLINAGVRPPDSQWQSPIEALDVNADSVIAPLDALLVINELGIHPGGNLPNSTANAAPYVDTNGDEICSPLDALLVINHLNAVSAMDGAAPQAPMNAAAVDTAWAAVPEDAGGRLDLGTLDVGTLADPDRETDDEEASASRDPTTVPTESPSELGFRLV